MLKIEDLEKQLNQGEAKGIYLLYGEETFLLEQQLKKIKKNFGELIRGINYISIDENNIQELIADIETPAFRISEQAYYCSKYWHFQERK